MNFLYTVGKTKMRHTDFHISLTIQLATIFTCQGDHFHPFFTGSSNSFNHVSGVTGSGNTQQNIPFLPYCFHIAGENRLITKIITHAGNMADIRDSDSRITRTVFTITPRQFFCKVHGIAVRAAITTRKYFATRFKRVSQ